jgi:hypothetical protein
LVEQSPFNRQRAPTPQLGHTPPPQSTSDSGPLRTASLQLGTWHSSGAPPHTPLMQSPPPRHFCAGPDKQVAPHEPPQSTSVSSASINPSAQCIAEQVPAPSQTTPE